ncbi:MAG: universal stress protein [Cyclobacteriaceae bacterium]|nr:universal stress protein [Cyclobacteriaceae bacterium]
MKKILVPCDFSKPAIQAFKFALEVAKQSQGSIHLVYVIELPVLSDTMLMPGLNFEADFLKELKEKSEKQFKKLMDKHAIAGVEITSETLFGSMFTSILDVIEKQLFDLVMLGSHGATGLREIIIGSNAEKIVRFSPIPVIVVKNYPKTTIKNIVFPNSLETEGQEDLVMKVKAMQNFFQAHLNVVWINTITGFTNDIITNKRLNAFAKRFMLKNYSLHIFNHLSQEEGILAFNNHINGDLIAMATHGRKGLNHIMNGSLAEDVVNHTNSPVWTYHLDKE